MPTTGFDSRSTSHRARRGAALLAASALGAGVLAAAPTTAQAATTRVDGATFTWGISGYAQKGTLAPWTINGATGDAQVLPGATQTEYKVAPTPATSLPADVTDVTAVKFTGGEGTVDPATGATTLTWEGSYTVAAYPAMFGVPSETYTDPVLTVRKNGSGNVTMRVQTSAGEDRDGGTVPAKDLGRVVLMTFGAGDLSGFTARGFRVTPDYQGVTAGIDGQTTSCSTAGGATGWWGSWPAAFVKEMPASLQAHFYSTGCAGMQDAKPPLPFDVSFGKAVKRAATVAVNKLVKPKPGKKGSVAVRVSSPFTGEPKGAVKVVLKKGKKSVATKRGHLAKGRVSVVLPKLKKGTFVLTAKYLGDAGHLKGSTKKRFKVK